LLQEVFTGGSKPAPPTEDEIMSMSRLAAEEGELRPQELRWVLNALELDKVKASEMMTPRTVVYSLPADLPLGDVKARSEHWVHSRLPLVADRNPDNVLGMVYRREVFDSLVKGQGQGTLRDLMHEIDFVPRTMRGHQLLDKFIKERKHMVAVVNEYGGFEGVVTLEDVLECLLGSEILDETDKHGDLQQLARQRARERLEHAHAGPKTP
jgi:CBS domain containing-hemolysin-like protein